MLLATGHERKTVIKRVYSKMKKEPFYLVGYSLIYVYYINGDSHLNMFVDLQLALLKLYYQSISY